MRMRISHRGSISSACGKGVCTLALRAGRQVWLYLASPLMISLRLRVMGEFGNTSATVLMHAAYIIMPVYTCTAVYIYTCTLYLLATPHPSRAHMRVVACETRTSYSEHFHGLAHHSK